MRLVVYASTARFFAAFQIARRDVNLCAAFTAKMIFLFFREVVYHSKHSELLTAEVFSMGSAPSARDERSCIPATAAPYAEHGELCAGDINFISTIAPAAPDRLAIRVITGSFENNKTSVPPPSQVDAVISYVTTAFCESGA